MKDGEETSDEEEIDHIIYSTSSDDDDSDRLSISSDFEETSKATKTLMTKWMYLVKFKNKMTHLTVWKSFAFQLLLMERHKKTRYDHLSVAFSQCSTTCLIEFN